MLCGRRPDCSERLQGHRGPERTCSLSSRLDPQAQGQSTRLRPSQGLTAERAVGWPRPLCLVVKGHESDHSRSQSS